MTYNIPVIDVPGPERSFSLPLTYRAGIRLEQEASWVGLGWSLNPGAIARSLNNYPDDASSESYASVFKKEVDRGWYGGVPGLLDLTWDSETGHSGTADLIGLASVGWENGQLNSGDLVGIKYTKGEGVSADPVRMAFAAVTIASIGSATAVTSSKSVATKAIAIGGEVGTSVGTSAAIGTAMGMVGRAGGSAGGNSRPIVRMQNKLLHTNYWVFFNDNKEESMYGSLYFQDMSQNVAGAPAIPGVDRGPLVYNGSLQGPAEKAPVYLYSRRYSDESTVEREVGGDLHQHVGRGESEYRVTSLRPISIAHDDFSVMGAGVSGSIRPQRLEVGSIAFPKKMGDEHDKYSLVPFLNDYKVGFRYENSASNGYDYHRYETPQGESETGITHDAQGEGSLIVRDERLKTRFTVASTGAPAATAPARKGVRNRVNETTGARERALLQGKHVEWYSNEEIEKQIYHTSAEGNGEQFLECYKPTLRSVRRQQIVGYTLDTRKPFATRHYIPRYDSVDAGTSFNAFRIRLPGKGIGAFRVTAEDGTTYHYSLPVYHYATYSEANEKTTDRPSFSSSRLGDGTGQYIYATTWLLTAITSSDYVDRHHLGVVDDQDWGGWVKFEYGRFAPHYKWRQPYVGEAYPEPAGPQFVNENSTGSFSEGAKQTYYLNSIRTRSHTALFVKSVRQDGRGHFSGRTADQSPLGLDEQKPSSSLRLDEIILLTNQDADKLATANGILPAGSTAAPVPALTANTADNAHEQDTRTLANGDTYRYVLDAQDIAADARIRDYINQRALKRVVFHYSYRLCVGTPNSFASLSPLPKMGVDEAHLGRSGKLTLESLSTFGPLNTKLIPDFKFTYGSNPAYGRGKWDGFGMYNSRATDTRDGHAIIDNHQAASEDGAAWSLTEILTPLGSRTRIAYERDQYAMVSEYGTKQLTFRNSDCSNTLQVQQFPVPLTSYLRTGDTITITGRALYKMQCTLGARVQDQFCENEFFYKRVPIANVTDQSITIHPADWPSTPPCTGPGECTNNPIAQGAELRVLLPQTQEGGDVRVASVTTLDENNTPYQIRYRYELATKAPRSTSTGVISKLPEFVDRDKDIPMYGVYDYPGTSVLYGRVTVLRGQFRAGQDDDHDQREVYTFFTPVSRMISLTQKGDFKLGVYLGKKDYSPPFQPTASTVDTRVLRQQDNRITVDVGKIGQPIAIEKYNRRGEREMVSQFGYSRTLPNPDGLAGQGRFTEGLLTSELLDRVAYHLNRTTKEYLPLTGSSTTTTANGMQTTSWKTLYDFLTGQLVETVSKNSLGDTYVTTTVPAYTLPGHSSMGLKAENPANRNMLTQTGETYVYKQLPSGERRVVAASVQTWNASWATYRGYSNGEYRDEGAAKPVWRQQASYVWNGAQLHADGTYAGFISFNWSQPTPTGQAAGWLKAGEVLRYDHFSKPLEAVDLNGQYASTKAVQATARTLASAANARYVEMAYSGAEDEVRPDASQPNVVHFEGEVRAGGQRDTLHHTGQYSSKLAAGEEGFLYHAPVGGAGVRTGRQYRLSAWVHRSDAGSKAARLFAKLNGTLVGETSISAPTTKKSGNWYLLNLYVTVPAGASGTLSAGCRNTGLGVVYVDDFRFHPLQGPLTAYAYDPHTGAVTYVLNNDNLYTRYFYDAAGKVTHVYKEVLDRPTDASPTPKLVQITSYNYARMREPNWVRTGEFKCEESTEGNYSTGYRLYRRKDVNPKSGTYSQLDWERGELTQDCPSCLGYFQPKVINGVCEEPLLMPHSCRITPAGQDSQGRPLFKHSYTYRYSDNTTTVYSFVDNSDFCDDTFDPRRAAKAADSPKPNGKQKLRRL
ncbi:hypothetical protein [Hymenobacter metallicola]|nr:hypothetical protein [Hymenobacter metallicola]